MTDMTYCGNAECPFKDCERHLVNAPICKPISFAMLDGTCRRYIGWLVDILTEGGDTNE